MHRVGLIWHGMIIEIYPRGPGQKGYNCCTIWGYVIIRIYATNPGVWFMHCHIDKHMFNGMAIMLNESYTSILESKYLPDGLPTCHSFNQTTIESLGSSMPITNCGKFNCCITKLLNVQHNN